MITNIIDRRRKPYLWRVITAIAEPTWHDNCVVKQEVDRVEQIYDDWNYDELPQTSLAEAIAWAEAKPGQTTLYLYDLGDGIRISSIMEEA